MGRKALGLGCSLVVGFSAYAKLWVWSTSSGRVRDDKIECILKRKKWKSSKVRVQKKVAMVLF